MKLETHSNLYNKLEEAIQRESANRKRRSFEMPDVCRSNVTSRTERSSRTEQCRSSQSSFEQSVELIDLEGASNDEG